MNLKISNKEEKINKQTFKKSIIIWIVIIIIVAIEQIIKYNMINKEFLFLKYVENYGIAFSLWNNDIGLIVTSLIIILIFIIMLYINIHRKKEVISIILLLSGSISNLIDRIYRGFVVDYINIPILNFPVFNIADILIFIGIISLFVIMFKNVIKSK